MKTLFAGMAIVMASLGGFTAAAGAAEIPPTPECSKLGKELIRGGFLGGGAWLLGDTKKAERKLAKELAKADCISDVEPHLKKVKSKPYSKQCVVAARKTGKLWAPTTRRLNRLSASTEKTSKALRKRTNRLSKRIKRLRSVGASHRRIKRLHRTKRKLETKQGRIELASMRNSIKVVEPISDDLFLILMELYSLRCAGDSLGGFGEGKAANDPVSQLLKKHEMTIVFSVLNVSGMFEIFEGIVEGLSPKASTLHQKLMQAAVR